MKLLVSFALAGACFASDWPRFRGPEGTGVSPEEWNVKALARPKVRWGINVGEGHASVAVAGKRLYTMGNLGGSDVVFCLDAETGKQLWRQPFPCPPGNFKGPRSTPTLDGGSVYTLSREGDALCLDAETGKVKWHRDLAKDHKAEKLDYGICGSPRVVGDSVLYNACAGGVALNKATGETLWASAKGPCGYATPLTLTAQGKECVAVFSATELLVLDPATGRKVQSYSWRTPFDANVADPVLFDGKLFITSGWDRGGALLDLSGVAAKPLWETRHLASQLSSPVYLDGHLYGVHGNTPNGELRCIDARTGDLKWTQKGAYENMMVAGGKILAVDKRGSLTVAEAAPAGYKELARVQVLNAKARNWTAPVLANGMIYCRNSDGDLVCLDVR